MSRELNWRPGSPGEGQGEPSRLKNWLQKRTNSISSSYGGQVCISFPSSILRQAVCVCVCMLVIHCISLQACARRRRCALPKLHAGEPCSDTSWPSVGEHVLSSQSDSVSTWDVFNFNDYNAKTLWYLRLRASLADTPLPLGLGPGHWLLTKAYDWRTMGYVSSGGLGGAVCGQRVVVPA